MDLGGGRVIDQCAATFLQISASRDKENIAGVYLSYPAAHQYVATYRSQSNVMDLFVQG